MPTGKIPIRNMKNKCLLLALLLGALACKEPGSGGDASIRGYVQAQKFNSTFTQFVGEYPAKDVDVYLIYGDRGYGYDDRTRTDYTGRFEFPYLYEGHYRLYVYSRDSTFHDASGTTAVVRNVLIDGRKTVADVDTLFIFE